MPTSDRASSTSLEGRTAIVTGGGSGIGQAIALLFARRGARVAILDLEADESMRQFADDGGKGEHIFCDVTSQGAVNAAFAATVSAFGPLDILVNSAGIAHVGTIEGTSEEDLDREKRKEVGVH